MTLTTRLAAEMCSRQGMPFASPHTLYRRLGKFLKAGLIRRHRMLWSGEYAYYLTKAGAAILRAEENVWVPPRATRPVAVSLQRHEYSLARFWIKFLGDCRHLHIPVVVLYRDGSLAITFDKQTLIPDGLAVLRIRGQHRAFFLEMDCGTQTSGAGGQQNAVLRKKFDAYRQLTRCYRTHRELAHLDLETMRIMVVCPGEQRLANLHRVARYAGLKKQIAFIRWPEIIEVTEAGTATGWRYRSTNLLATPLFSFPIRSPPVSILS